jgi:hypothetical protein
VIVRLGRAFAVIVGSFVLVLALYVGFIQAGLIRNPLAPAIRGDLGLARSDQDGLRVLFVGNSLTYYNDMPKLVSELGRVDPGAPGLFVVSYTRPGFSLRQASEQRSLSRLLDEIRWDVVVLQEKSNLVASGAYWRREHSDPYAKALAGRIVRGGARPVLFMTWGVQSDFTASQDAVDAGYGGLAYASAAPIAPVGYAWKKALRLRPDLDLWASDGAHPGRRGSYLTACVFYEYLTGREVNGNDFTAGIPRSEARFLQRIGSDIAEGTF